MTCAIGGVGEPPAINPGVDDPDEDESPYPGPHPAAQRDTFDDLDIDVIEGDTVEYHPAGNASVYGTREGTVVDVGPGAGEEPCLVIRTDSELKKIRPEWLASKLD